MKKLLAPMMVLPLLLFGIGCDTIVDPDPDPGADPTAIHGTWVSEGANVAPGLAALFGTTRITAVFRANNTYEVEERRGPNDPPIVLRGTYMTEASAAGDIRTITLTQTEPTTLTAAGIYEVTLNRNSMRYEVIQTEPFIGATPPSPAGGFGSTAIGGTATGPTWIQTYVRTQ
jgi:hypothetical protein